MKLRYITPIFAAGALLLPVNASASEPSRDSAVVNMPWGNQQPLSGMTGKSIAVTAAELEKAPVSDLRKRMTGLFSNLFITENTGDISRLGSYGLPNMNCQNFSLLSRGFSNIACIVDDVPLPFNQYLIDPAQIESVTMISDAADKAMIGPIASYGVLYIKTKSGGYDTPINIHLDVESGIDVAGIIPEWVDGVTYAQLNNQARLASGYSPRFTDEMINGLKRNDPMDLTTPNVNFQDLMLRNFKPVTSFALNANGGSKNLKYNMSVTGLNDNSIIKIGPVDDFNKINFQTSITARIGNYLEANVSSLGMVSINRRNIGFDWSEMVSTPAVSFPLKLKVDESSPFYDPNIMTGDTDIYGVSRQFTNNPYAAAMEGGYGVEKRRSASFNASLNFDMSWLLKGLKSVTFFNLSSFYISTPGKYEDYLAYFWNAEDAIESISWHVGNKSSDKMDFMSGSYQSLNFYERLTYDWTRDKHSLNLSGLFYMCNQANSEASNYQRQMYGIGTVRYSYAGKYNLDLVSEYAGSGRFCPDKRYAWFPAVGASWVISKEDFARNSSWLDFMKLYSQAGVLGDADVYSDDNYLWQGIYSSGATFKYGPASNLQWFGSQIKERNVTTLTQIPNHELTWSKIYQMDAGLEMSVFDCLDIRANWFLSDHKGIISNVSPRTPYAMGYSGTAVYQNYNAYRHSGVEAMVRYHRDWKDFGFSIGTSLMSWNVLTQKESDNFYQYEYQNLEGKSSTAIWGYRCLGKFTSEQEISSSALITAQTHVGDLKYEDVNEDGVIDNNDQVVIGDGDPDLRYTLNLELRWKKFDLSVAGIGNFGSVNILSGDYFWGKGGDGQYSKFIADNVGGRYPSLSYTRSINNFQESDFWLENGDYFRIKSVELAYNMDFPASKFIKGMRISLRGGNLLTLTSVKYIDPEAVIAGISCMPLFKSYTAGVKFNF